MSASVSAVKSTPEGNPPPSSNVCWLCHPTPPQHVGHNLVRFLLCAHHTAEIALLGLSEQQRSEYLDQRMRDFPITVNNPTLSALIPDPTFWVTCPASVLVFLEQVA